MNDEGCGVWRPRLFSLLAAKTLVEAPAGWGKTSFARQVASRWRADGHEPLISVRLHPGQGWRAFKQDVSKQLRAQSLQDAASVAAAADDPEALFPSIAGSLRRSGDRLLLIIDDLHHGDGDVNRSVVEALRTSALEVLALGRALASNVHHAADLIGAAKILPRDLAMTDSEARELISAVAGTEMADVMPVLAEANGWPAAVALVALRMRLGGGVNLPRIGRDMVRSLCDAAVAELSADDLAALTQLAHLPMFDERLGGLIGRPGLLRAGLIAGIPMTRGRDGWLSIASPVSRYLQRLSPLTLETVRTAADWYDARQEHGIALSTLLRVGLHQDGLRHFATMPADERAQLDDGVVHLLTALTTDDALFGAPEVAPPLISLLWTSGRWRELADLLDRLHRLETRLPPSLVTLVKATQLAFDAAEYGIDRDEILTKGAALLESAGVDDRAAVALALTAIGRSLATSREPEDVVTAEAHLRKAASLARAAGEPTIAISALAVLAYYVLHARARFEEADAVLQGVAELEPYLSRGNAMRLAQRAENAVAAGHLDQAEMLIAEAESVLGLLQRQDLDAVVVGWPKLYLASARQDLQEVRRLHSALLACETGVKQEAWISSDAAITFARAAEIEQATALIAEAARLTRDVPPVMRVAQLAIACRTEWRREDEELAERLIADTDLEPREEWRAHLYIAAGRLLQGARQSAREAFAQMRHSAAALNAPSLPGLHEPELVARMAKALAGDQPVQPALEIRVLGRFSVQRAGAPVATDTPVPARLLQFLVVRGGRCGAYAAAHALWPDVDDSLGRQRLRNVVLRVRRVYGDVITRAGDRVQLSQDLQVDLWQLTETARDLASGVTLTDQQLRDSASQWRGELLPDCYDEWVELPRESARRNYLEVVDELASRAHRRGDLDEELRWLEKGHVVAPYDETRPIRAVRLLTTSGRIGAAREMYGRAVRILEDLGVGLSVELRQLRGSLRQ